MLELELTDVVLGHVRHLPEHLRGELVEGLLGDGLHHGAELRHWNAKAHRDGSKVKAIGSRFFELELRYVFSVSSVEVVFPSG